MKILIWFICKFFWTSMDMGGGGDEFRMWLVRVGNLIVCAGR